MIDCATSVNQRGKIERYGREGLSTPRGAVIDNEGIERTDTEGILRDMVLGKCALTPVGTYFNFVCTVSKFTPILSYQNNELNQILYVIA